MTTREVPSVGLGELRALIGGVVEQAMFYRQPTIIARYNKPAAVVVSYDWWLEQHQNAADTADAVNAEAALNG